VGKHSVESPELEETDQNSRAQVENDIEKMSTASARVAVFVAFNVNSFDYLSVKGNLDPVARYLKIEKGARGNMKWLFQLPRNC